MTDTSTILMAVAVGEGALALGALWLWWKAEDGRQWAVERLIRHTSVFRDISTIARAAMIPLPAIPADYDESAALDARRADRAANQARARKGAATKRARVMDDPIMKEAAR